MNGPTRKELQDGYDFWIWAAENPGLDKKDWPELRRLKGHRNWCPFCSYFVTDGGPCEEECPMVKAGAECDIGGDPYDIWRHIVCSNEFGVELTEKEKIQCSQAAIKIAEVFKNEIEKSYGGRYEN
jgi:hypothetical protein